MDGSQASTDVPSNRFAETVRRLGEALERETVPIVIAVREQGWAFGLASSAAEAMTLTPASPMRVASNTKTFVAATMLRLHEEGVLDIDASVARMVGDDTVWLLRNGGYDVEAMTLRHLLDHSSGLWDHADENYIGQVLAEPTRCWSRHEQVRLCMEIGLPAAPVGTAFRYSDTGYIILGEVIERVTDMPLAAAVRHYCGFDALGLSATWWEEVEQPPFPFTLNGRQFHADIDIATIDPTMDLYGGGGLVMSAGDLAKAFTALFDGRVFRSPETLEMMLGIGGHQGAADYRLGIFVVGEEPRRYFWHTGFWGSGAFHLPASGLTVAGFVSRRDDRLRMVEIIQAELRVRMADM